MSIVKMNPGPGPGRNLVRAGLWFMAVVLSMAPVTTTRAEDKELPQSNLALLDHALDLVAEVLLDRAAIPSGTRLAIATEGERPVDADMEHAFLNALTQRGFEAWALDTGAPAANSQPASVDTSTAELSPDLQAAQESRMRTLGLDPNEAESPYSGGSAGSTSSAQQDWLAGVADNLPVLIFEVEEARVDYPRMYRSGVFGGQHVERRAMARVSARILRAENRAVYWVGVADTSLSDVVPRSDLKFLEDKTRAETRGTVPTSNWTKIAEPVLVVALVVGLVALFYSNRP